MGHDPFDYVKSRFDNVTESGPGKWTALARCHDDHENSVRITLGDDGRVLLTCDVCRDNSKTFAAHGIDPKRLFVSKNGHRSNGHAKANGKPKTDSDVSFKKVAKYTYYDRDGNYVFDVTRKERVIDGKKQKIFPQSHIKADGTYVNNIDDVPRPLPLYRLPQLTKADPKRPALIVEGEKDVHNLDRVKILATTNPGGAGKWLPEYSESLRGRPAYVVRDNDAAGESHVKQVAKSLYGIAGSLKVIELPNLPPKGDISDWLEQNGVCSEKPISQADIERVQKALKDILDATPDWQPSPDDAKEIEQAKQAQPAGDAEKPPAKAEEHDDDPHRLARCFFGMHCRLEGLYHYRSEFYLWEREQSAYRKMGDDEIKGRLVTFIKEEFDDLAEKEALFAKEGTVVHVKKVTVALVNNVLMVLRSLSQLPDHVDAPFWIELKGNRWIACNGPIPACECLVAPNGILHLPSFSRGENRLIEPTPSLFTTNAITFSYDPAETCPQWLRFINEDIFQLDMEQQDALAELAWYLLTPRTEQQKLFMFIGPARSGKGTIAHVLRALIGEGSAASSTLGDLAGRFGLEPLLGKTLVVVGDCRVGTDRDVQARIVERLLSITGEDQQCVDRKGIPSIPKTRLPVRFLILSNEVPSLGDASATLPGRAIMFRLSESYYGREDTKLIGRLLGELPGILNWALAAGKRFEDRGRFEQPQSGQELIRTSKEQASPIAIFAEDCLVVGVAEQISRPRLEELWEEWSRKHGERKKIWHVIGDLQALFPTLRIGKPRDGEGRQVKTYYGIGENLDSTYERQKARLMAE